MNTGILFDEDVHQGHATEVIPYGTYINRQKVWVLKSDKSVRFDPVCHGDDERVEIPYAAFTHNKKIRVVIEDTVANTLEKYDPQNPKHQELVSLQVTVDEFRKRRPYWVKGYSIVDPEVEDVTSAGIIKMTWRALNEKVNEAAFKRLSKTEQKEIRASNKKLMSSINKRIPTKKTETMRTTAISTALVDSLPQTTLYATRQYHESSRGKSEDGALFQHFITHSFSQQKVSTPVRNAPQNEALGEFPSTCKVTPKSLETFKQWVEGTHSDAGKKRKSSEKACVLNKENAIADSISPTPIESLNHFRFFIRKVNTDTTARKELSEIYPESSAQDNSSEDKAPSCKNTPEAAHRFLSFIHRADLKTIRRDLFGNVNPAEENSKRPRHR